MREEAANCEAEGSPPPPSPVRVRRRAITDKEFLSYILLYMSKFDSDSILNLISFTIQKAESSSSTRPFVVRSTLHPNP